MDEYRMCYLLAYLHHNPIHHNFVTNYDDWKYSSWTAYKKLFLCSTLNRLTPLSWFGSDLETAKTRFFQYHEDFKTDKQIEKDTIEESE